MRDVLLLHARPACRARWSGTGEIHENRAASESRVTRKRGCYLANRIVLIGCMTPPFEESLTVRSVVRVDSSAKRSRRTPHAAVAYLCGVPTERRSDRRYAGGIAAI